MPRPKSNTVKLEFHTHPDVSAYLRELASDNNMPVSQLLRVLVGRALDAYLYIDPLNKDLDLTALPPASSWNPRWTNQPLTKPPANIYDDDLDYE